LAVKAEFDTGDTSRLQGFGGVHGCTLQRIFSGAD
jgi:hypothetical protein